jgi:ATP-dependent protease ClpP protease subunit
MFSSRNIMNDGEEAAEVAKQFNFLENTLLKHRTLTIFGEIRQEVAQRTVEKLLALSYDSDAPITIFVGSDRLRRTSISRRRKRTATRCRIRAS